MHKNIKKIITGIAVIAIMATMITPIGVSARTYNAGTLFWDFESSDDVAYYAGNNTLASVVEPYNTGSWAREWSPHNGDMSWRFTVTQKAYSTDFAAPTNGGNNGVHVCQNQSAWEWHSLGMGIMLSEKELIPGREYTISADVKRATDRTDNHTRSVYVGFSKPSQRAATAATSVKKEKTAWLTSGVYSKMNLASGSDLLAIGVWDNGTATFTAPESLYEDGYVMLYLSIGRGNGFTGNALGQEDVYFDNVRITPVKAETNKTTLAKIGYGKIWDFEEGASVDHNDNIGLETNIMGTYAEGKWAPIDDNKVVGTAPYFVPRYLTKATATGNMGSNDGVPAFSGNMCLATTSNMPTTYDWSDTTNGAKILLSEEDFPEGTYTLSMLAGSNSQRNKTIHASVFKGTVNIPTKDYTAVTGALVTATQTYNMGKFGNWWGRFTTEITLDEDDYDENGNFTLVIHMDNGGMKPNEHLYLDDISLYSEERTIAAGDKVNFFVTTVSDAPISNILSLAATKEGYALKDCDVSETSVSAIDTKNYTVQIPSGVTNPEFKLYMWNKTTLEPIALPMD